MRYPGNSDAQSGLRGAYWNLRKSGFRKQPPVTGAGARQVSQQLSLASSACVTGAGAVQSSDSKRQTAVGAHGERNLGHDAESEVGAGKGPHLATLSGVGLQNYL